MRVIVFVAGALIATLGSGSPLSPVNTYLEAERDIDTRGIIDSIINSTLNRILANMSETVQISSLPLDLGSGEKLSGHLNLDDIKIYGLKSLVATEISATVSLNIGMYLSLHELLINLKYVADLLLFQLVPLYGDGAVTLTFDEVGLDIAAKAILVDDSGSIEELSIIITLGKAVFDLTGMINSPEFSSIISNVLNENFAKFVNENQEVVSNTISPVIKDVINDMLRQPNSTMLGFEDLFKLIE